MATPGTPEPTSPPSAAEIEAFDSFPWSKHKVFLLGLVETLGGQPALYPNPTHEGSAAFCRTVFFRRQTGRRIDLTQYNLYRDQHPEYPSIDRRLLTALYAAAKELDLEAAAASLSLASSNPNDSTPPPQASYSRRIAEAVAVKPLINPFDGTPTPPIRDTVPSWQRRAPKSRLQVEKEASSAASAEAADGEAPYSDKFAKIVEAIQSGKELEGIKQIPDTVLRQPGVVPLGKLTAPRKPWERHDAAQNSSILSFLASSNKTGSTEDSNPYQTQAPLGGVDLEFPPPPEEDDAAEAGLASEPEAAEAAAQDKAGDEVERVLDAHIGASAS
ncbi:hypothetical protein F503_08084 [Ophiostoma piceae UAMH 11346]|uniref:Uncharacterized protein n=1 Tax=Ophiostoma piceae (strain UAMH 11346) TaxID=1262450 RepID=S3CLN7_OPHP1|nr:hypothetical protein F503_08084 [Ophiostoma piceae UAMH 11346]